MKTKLIKLLTVAALSAGSVAAVGAIVALSDKTEVPTNLSADDTRILEVTAEDIKDAIGAGSSGNFTVDGIGFSVSGVSYSAGKAIFSEGTLKTTVASGSTTGSSGLAGAGYISAEFVDLDTNAGAWVYSKDDLGNNLGGDLIPGDTVSASYSINLQAHATATFAVTNVRIEFGGPGETEFSSLKLSYKCAVPVDKHMVRFLVDGDQVNAQLIPDGGNAVAPDDPTKSPTSEIAKFVFTGWDKDPATTVITADTDFIAQFDEYVYEDLVDDFSSYTVDAELEDGGWFVTTYKNNTWSKETTANVVLSKNSIEDGQALRLNSYRNGVGYKILKEFDPNPFTKCANAVKFTMMTPVGATECRVLLYTHLTLEDGYPPFLPPGSVIDLQLKHEIPLTSGEYVEYTIPYDAEGWQGNYTIPEEGMRAFAEGFGVNIDKLHTMIYSMEFYFVYPEHAQSNYCGFVDSVSFVTTESKNIVKNESLKQYSTYTGYNLEGNVVRVDINNDMSATASVIDIETPIHIPGNVTIDGNELTFTSADSGATLTYTGTATNRGQKINFKEASGTAAPSIGSMELNAVQSVETFEQYDSSGTAYSKANLNPEARSGARGAYYTEYYTGQDSDSTTFGGSKWSLMETGEELSLMNDANAHSGTKYASLLNSKTVGNRYVQFSLFDGTSDVNSYRGTTLSFWARSSGLVKSFKAYAYSQPKPETSTISSMVKSLDFVETSQIDDWTHYEVNLLDPTRVYYGFMMFLAANNTNDSYLYIDDVEIYTANPYAEYVEPIDPSLQKDYPEGSFKGTVNVGGTNYNMVFAFGNETNGLVAVKIANTDAQITSMSYDKTTGEFSIETSGTYESKAIGIITGIYEKAYDKITHVSCAGALAPSNNGSITALRLDVYDCDGTTDELQAQFKRRYMSGSWQVDTGNADRLTSNTTEFVSGTGALKRRGWTGGAVALNFNSDFSPAKTVKQVQFWVYNPSEGDITLRMWGYKATGFNSNFETGSVTAKAGQWTYVSMGFNEATIYNWQIADFNNTGVYLTFDNIVFL